MLHEETNEKWRTEKITISKEDFADTTARLLAEISLGCAKECSDKDELTTLLLTSELIIHFTHTLMNKLFEEHTLQIKKEER